MAYCFVIVIVEGRGWHLLAYWAAMLALSITLAGCGQPQADQGTTRAGSTVLPAQTGVPTPTLTDQELSATKVALLEESDRERTAVAISWEQGTPFVFTPIPIPTSRPMPTPVPGLSSCGGANSIYIWESCWAWPITGGYLYVKSGARKSDREQGLLRVYPATLDRSDYGLIQFYNAPARVGPISIADYDWPRLTLINGRNNPTITSFRFNLLARTWEQPGNCQLYPIALHTEALSGSGTRSRFILRNAQYGTSNGNFGWLNWTGLPVSATLAVSLTPPGDSTAYVNPNNPSDHTVSIGDWVVGRPQVTNNPAVENALADLASKDLVFAVPVWDQATRQGSDLRYRVSGYAWMYGIENVSLVRSNTLSFKYWGPASCPDSP